MTTYPVEYKETIVKKMMGDEAVSMAELIKESGVSRSTLYKWRQQYGLCSKGSAKMSGEMKFATLLETASLNEIELAEYCRSKGLYVEDISGWKSEAIQCYSGQHVVDDGLKKELRASKKEAAKLAKDIARKDKALAEAAALLILSKNASAIWGEFGVE